jgi:hypothetical protein
MIVGVEQRIIHVGEGPRMVCLECGERVPFDLKLAYYSVRLGALGCACRLRWVFQCRVCQEAWLVKRSLVREFEKGGVPIPFLERDGLLTALAFLAFFLLIVRL